MRIARTIPAKTDSRNPADVRRAQNLADVMMAANLRRSRNLARKV
jgi:hypothetical protein